MGFIPLIPKTELYPFGNNTGITSGYLHFLGRARGLMLSCVGTVHAATLYWKYDKEHKLYREGNFKTEGLIVEVNKSNVVYEHVRTHAYVNSNDWYTDLIPRVETDRYIARDRYLKKVRIRRNEKHCVNPCDDDS